MKEISNANRNKLSSRNAARAILWLWLDVLLALPAFSQSPIDGFDPDVTGTVFATAIQSDGKIIIGGVFTAVGGTTCHNIARLNADGSLNTTFNSGAIGSTAGGAVWSVVVQADGKILVGGDFNILGGEPRNDLGRFNADGSVDLNFNPGANAPVSSFAVQADGRIVVGGYFTQLGGQPRNYICRLHSDLFGTLDSSFDPGVSGNSFPSVQTLVLQADGKILVGGLFTTLGGWPRNNLGRLNSSGAADPSFDPAPNDVVNALTVQPDGKIVAGGNFTMLRGEMRNRIGRLSADGSLDATFNPGPGSGIYEVDSLVLQPDGKILVGGSFSTLGGGGSYNVARLNTDGSADDFPGAAGTVRSLAVQPDGKIVVGGTFTLLANKPRNSIGRLYTDGRPNAHLLGPAQS